LFQVSRARDYYDFVAATFQWLSPYVSSSTPDLIFNYFNSCKNFFQEYFTEISYEAFNPFSFLRRVLNSGFLTAIRDAIVVIASTNLCPEFLSGKIQSLFGPLPSMPLVDFLDRMSKTLENLMYYFNLYMEGYTLSQLFTEEDPFSAAIDAANKLLVYEDRLYLGLPTKGRMEVREFYASGDQLLKTIKDLIPRLKRSDKRSMILTNLGLKLEGALASAQQLIGGKIRTAPLAFVVHGLPGTGKSKIIDHLLRVHCYVRNRKWSYFYKYSRTKSSKYWEGYIPSAHPYILYSELGSKHRDLVKAKGDDLLEELTSLIDEQEFSCDMAFEGKGKVKANPEVVIVDTNNPNLNLEYTVNNPSAFYRRFIFVEVTVKPEFKLKDGVGIDPAKSFGSGGDLMDRWNFRVTTRLPTANSSFETLVKMESGNIHDFSELLTSIYEQDIEKSAATRERLQHDYDISPYVPKFNAKLQELKENEEKYWEEIRLNIAANPSRNTLSAIRRREGMSDFDVDDYKEAPAPQRVNEFESWNFLPIKRPLTWEWWFIEHRLIIPIFTFLFTVLGEFFIQIISLALSQSIRNRVIFTAMLFLLYNMSRGAFYTLGLQFLLLYLFIFTRSNFTLNLARLYLETRRTDSWSMIKYHTGLSDTIQIVRTNKRYKIMLAVAASMSLVLTTVAVFLRASSRDKIQISSQSEVLPRTDIDERTIEERFGCSPPKDRLLVKNTMYWNTVDYPQVTQQMQNTLETVSNVARRNTREALIAKGDGYNYTNILGVYGNIAIINTHALGDLPASIKVAPTYMGAKETTSYRNSIITQKVEISSDLSLIALDEIQFRDIRPFITEQMVKTNICYINGVRSVLSVNDSIVINPDNPSVHANVYEYSWSDHAGGKCGTPIIVPLGAGFAIAGVHFAGERGSSRAYALPLYRGALVYKGKCHEIFSEDIALPDTEFPNAKSPFAYAPYHSLYLRGKLPGAITLPKKSEVRPNSLRSVYEKILNMSLIDSQGPKFGAPVMLPHMRGDVYVSPYHTALGNINTERAVLSEEICDKVYALMLDRFCKGCSPIQPLTFDATLNGAANDSYLRSMNLSTSAGHGFFGKKRDHILTDENGKRIVKQHFTSRR
jgi:hypothetical protein